MCYGMNCCEKTWASVFDVFIEILLILECDVYFALKEFMKSFKVLTVVSVGFE